MRDERGSVIVTSLLCTVVLGLIATTLLRTSWVDLGQTEHTVATNRSLQAAEAGVEDYIAKLTEDHAYFDHVVHPAESTRRPTGCVVDACLRDAGVAWDGGITWGYADANWRALGNGLEYNLRIERPTSARPMVRIVATGRRTGQPSTAKAVEVLVRPASIADYQMISTVHVRYGPTATTYGKVYAGRRPGAQPNTWENANVVHAGTVHADIYAEGSIYQTSSDSGVTGSGRPNYQSGALDYPGVRTNDRQVRDKVPTPIDFNWFESSLTDVQRAAEAGGRAFAPADGVDAYRVTFRPDGTFEVRSCTGNDLSGVEPSCGAPAAYPVPTNGAIWLEEDTLVEGTVQGRVTVATPGKVIVGGVLRPETPGTDVVGVISRGDMIVAAWAPEDLEWSAATLTIRGAWRSHLEQPVDPYATGANRDTFVFTGSTATYARPYMSQFNDRTYNYDPNLLFLQPPYFPVLEQAYTVVRFREVPVPA